MNLLQALAERRAASARYSAAFEAAKSLTRAAADELCAAHIALNAAVDKEVEARCEASAVERLAYYEDEHAAASKYYQGLPAGAVLLRFHARNQVARCWQKVLDARFDCLTPAEREELEYDEHSARGYSYALAA
jgi:hypothetical protein